ncbi:hypothetical protein GUJ93_ZPchr0010g8689, partial [Zizania palustris]
MAHTLLAYYRLLDEMQVSKTEALTQAFRRSIGDELVQGCLGHYLVVSKNVVLYSFLH